MLSSRHVKRGRRDFGTPAEIDSAKHAIAANTAVAPSRPMGLRDRIDALVTWNGIWSVARQVNNLRRTLLLRPLEEHPENPKLLKKQRRLDALLPILDGSAKFRRRLTFAMVRAIRGLRSTGHSEATIRALTVGRVLRSDGTIHLPTWRRRTVRVLGWLWAVLTVTISVLLLTLLWATPGSLLTKALLTVPLVLFFLFCWLYIDAITQRALSAAQGLKLE